MIHQNIGGAHARAPPATPVATPLLMLTRTFRVNGGASASSNLDIMTIWDALKGSFGKSDFCLLEVRMSMLD